MARAYVGVGSNNEPERNVLRALRLLAERETLIATSTVYRSPALDRPEQPDYYNCVVAIETTRPPAVLKEEVLGAIETQLGRRRGADRFEARTIDLDLLAYEGTAAAEGNLALPHADIARRAFVALPLAELAPGLPLPDRGQSVAQVAAALDADGIVAQPEYTRRLREELQLG